MPEIKPRYEFRIWADSLEVHREKLNAMARPSQKSSNETYFVSAATEKCNAKVRDKLMDIKVFVAEDRGLEQWKPILKAEFPLAAAVITDQVFPGLQLAAPQPSKPQYTYEEFLDEIMRTNPKIAVAAVSKTRDQFNIGVCAAEYSKIMINNIPRDTVAVESTDADAVLQLVDKLGINEPNVSYIREIRRIVGWSEGN
jgi:exopolyphosphatase/guanosine-5'-triphosphate,3'-diphosphate pyrophosphatase